MTSSRRARRLASAPRKGRFLRAGDTVEVEVEGLGALANPVVAAVDRVVDDADLAVTPTS